ncbi:hypothetical protein BH10CYA1_BH10CYA1_59970 [soil metagenome]
MNKDDANELLNLGPAATAAQVKARYKQIEAFFNIETGSCLALATESKMLFTQAYALVEPKASVENKQNKQFKNDDKKTSDESAKPLSDKWWKANTVRVLIALGALAVILYEAPRVFHSSPSSPYQPYTQPYQPTYPPVNTNPIGAIGAPPDTTGGENANPSSPDTRQPQPPISQPTNTWPSPNTDSKLNPLPNANPLTIAPSQTPSNFLLDLFTALNAGTNTSALIQNTTRPSIVRMLMTSHPYRPVSIMPQDALQVLTQNDGSATVRVNEKYFTGVPTLYDYFLVSDNGVWKLSDIKPVTGVTP